MPHEAMIAQDAVTRERERQWAEAAAVDAIIIDSNHERLYRRAVTPADIPGTLAEHERRIRQLETLVHRLLNAEDDGK